MSDCLFCKIINKEIPGDIQYESDNILIFKDIAPQAKIHYLAIPKKHYKDYLEFSQADEFASFFSEVAEFSKSLGEFRLVSNCGAKAGQSVFHVHFHILSGEQLGSFGK